MRALVFLLIASLFFQPACWCWAENRLDGKTSIVDPRTAGGAVDDLTRQILLKEISLERFNIHYGLEAAKQGRWKGWRYAAFQEVNAGTGLAGAILGTAAPGPHTLFPIHPVNAVQESSCIVPMVGTIIGASAAALEFGINQYHDYQAGKKGFSPIAARSYVLALRNDIDRLLARRDALIKVESSAPELSGQAEIDIAEGKILSDLRHQGIIEFERFHIGARRLLAFQQAQYLFDLSKYTINALGFEFAYLAIRKHDRKWNFKAGLMWDIAGPLYIAAPILSRVFGKAVGEMHRRFLRPLTQDAETNALDTLEADCAYLNKLCKNVRHEARPVEAPLNRAEMYGLRKNHLRAEIQQGIQEAQASKLSATQNIGAGVFVGGIKLAQGILTTIPGYYSAYNGNTNRAVRVTNSDLFVASVINIPATAVAIADTLRIQVQGEINRHRLIKAGLLPRQVAVSRLKELDDMERTLVDSPTTGY